MINKILDVNYQNDQQIFISATFTRETEKITFYLQNHGRQ